MREAVREKGEAYQASRASWAIWPVGIALRSAGESPAQRGFQGLKVSFLMGHLSPGERERKRAEFVPVPCGLDDKPDNRVANDR